MSHKLSSSLFLKATILLPPIYCNNLFYLHPGSPRNFNLAPRIFYSAQTELISIVFVSIYPQDTLIVFIMPSSAQVHTHPHIQTFPDSAGPPSGRTCHLEEFPSAWPGIRLLKQKQSCLQNWWHFPPNLWLAPGWLDNSD